MLYNRIPITIGQFQLITGPTVSYQYDIEQYLVFNSVTLPDYYTVDFCNVGDSQTVTITGTPDGVRIPDELLLNGRDIKAYVVLTGTDEGAVETRYEITLPVRNRPMRQGVEPTPEERLEIETLVNALNDGVERAEDAAIEAEGQADRAETAADSAQSAVEHYPKIEDGYWYVWLNGGWVNTGVKAEGVDGRGIASVTGQKTSTSGLVDTYTLTVTYTDSTTDTITFTVTNGRDGVDGYSPTATVTKSGNTATITITDKNDTTTATVTDGTDGVSPEVTIETITGGHRVTITDKDHPTGQSFDVMDGEVSQSDLDAALATKAPVIIDTASGAIASFSDGADGMPIKALTVSIEPQQDLHGQDAPYPAGGGKNVFQSYAETATVNGVTFTANADGTVTANGTASADIIYPVSKKDETSPSQEYCHLGDLGLKADLAYVLNGDSSGAYNSTHWIQMLVYGSGTEPYSASADSNPFSFSESDISSKWYRLAIRVKRGTQLSNFVFKPMIRLASVTDPTFAPYSNECPISGWTGLSLARDGVNVWDEQWELGGLNASNGANWNTDTRIRSKNYIPIKPSANYYISYPTSWVAIDYCFYDVNKTFISSGYGANVVFTVPANAYYMRFATYAQYGTTYNHDISINYPSTDHDYHAYTGETIPISWQTEAGTVYGANIQVNEDGTGKLTVDVGYKEYDGSDDEGWLTETTATVGRNFYLAISDAKGGQYALNSKLMSNQAPASPGLGARQGFIFLSQAEWFNVSLGDVLGIQDVSGWRTYLSTNPLQVVYELATPVEYQLDPITLNTLYGTNNIFADCGDVSVDYPCDTKLYIDRPTEPAEDDMIADTLITSGKYFFVNNRLFLSTASIAVGAMIIPGSNCVETSIAEALNTLNS